jgi:ABC-type lipoprotein export system ATPase subunit
MWKTAVRFPHIPTALLRCLRRFFRIERKNCLILADEPTGNLDRKNRQLIFNLLRQEHRKGRGIILITHDMETAIQADTIFQLEDGRLAPTKADSPTIGSI